MRIAFVTVGDTSRKTGGYLYNARVISGLRERGVEIEEFVPCGATPEEQEAASPKLGALDPVAFDVVVVDALARIAVAPHLDRWREARPVVALVHELPGVAAPETGERERGYEAPLLRADLLLVPSGDGEEILVKRGVPVERVRVDHPGFDRLPVQAEPRRKDGTVRVLCVAQWIPRKGILDLVRAWRALGLPDAVLELVGETDADPAYAVRVREAVGDDPSILVRGPVEDETLVTAYASADVFALPSRYEGYGIVFAEALAAGLPIIACEVGPVPDLVGDAALLVPPGDVAAISESLSRLVPDPTLREKLSAAARRRAGALPSWEDTTKGFLGVLEEASEERALR